MTNTPPSLSPAVTPSFFITLKRAIAAFRAVWTKQKEGRGPCFECGSESHHNHHVVPRSRGGTSTVPLCVECHRKAHADDPPKGRHHPDNIVRAVVLLVTEHGFSASAAGRLLGVPESSARRFIQKYKHDSSFPCDVSGNPEPLN